MASFNKVILMGNLTRDPEVRVTASGMSICKLGLAVTRKFKTADGEMREDTAFVDVDSFGRQAETLSKYLTKGSPLFVEGRLKFDQWETSEGEKRSKLGVVLENFQFVGGRSEGGASGESNTAQGENAGYERTSPPPRTTQPAATEASSTSTDIDEDVPF